MTQKLLPVLALVVASWGWRADATSGRADDGGIGYSSSAAALLALHAKSGVVFSARNGWTIAADAASYTVWSFAPIAHPAYPAAVKRQLVKTPGGISVKTDILCGGPQDACDKLPSDFRELDENMKSSLFPQSHP